MFEKRIERWCCPRKQDFLTKLYFWTGFSSETGEPILGYRRESNDDWYFGPVSSESELNKLVEDPYYKL